MGFKDISLTQKEFLAGGGLSLQLKDRTADNTYASPKQWCDGFPGIGNQASEPSH